MDTLNRIPESYFENHRVTILLSVAVFFFFIPRLVPVAGKVQVIFQISLKVELVILTLAL